LKNIFDWIQNQPDNIPFKSIKLSFSTIASKLQEIEGMLSSPEINNAVHELNEKNQKLSGSLSEIEEKLLMKSADLEKLGKELKGLQQILDEKDEEIRRIVEEKLGNTDLNPSQLAVIKLESELEAKTYEVIMKTTENKRLVNDLLHSNKSNEFYIKTIEELKDKLRNARQDVLNRTEREREKENLRTLPKTPRFSESATQTATGLRIPKKKPPRKGLQDFISFTSCMASAIEALLDSRP